MTSYFLICEKCKRRADFGHTTMTGDFTDERAILFAIEHSGHDVTVRSEHEIDVLSDYPEDAPAAVGDDIAIVNELRAMVSQGASPAAVYEAVSHAMNRGLITKKTAL